MTARNYKIRRFLGGGATTIDLDDDEYYGGVLPHAVVTPDNVNFAYKPEKKELTSEQLIRNMHNATGTVAKEFVLPALMGATSAPVTAAFELGSRAAHGIDDRLGTLVDIAPFVGMGAGLGVAGARALKPLAVAAREFGSSPGRYIFLNLPYRQIDNTIWYTKGFIDRLRRPIRDWNKYDYRKHLKDIPDVSLPEGTIVNSKSNPVELLKLRFQKKPRGRYREPSTMVLGGPEFAIEDYMPWDRAKVYTRNPLETSLFWLAGNYNPGFSMNSSSPYIHLNRAHLKSLGFDYDLTKAHELVHTMDLKPTWLREPYAVDPPSDAFNFDRIHPDIADYFIGNSNTELAARGSQLKNYFGFTSDEPLTGDLLKYAGKHYVQDTKMDNNMSELFSIITDWDKAARYLNDISL